MDVIVKAFFVVILAVSGLVMNMNLSTFSRSTQYLKEDLELAVHDAALEIDFKELANGKFVFDVNRARSEFKDSFKKNTGLTENDYKILEFKALDNSNTQFPYTYKSNNSKFENILFSPSLIVIIETSTESYFIGSEKKPIKQVASYSYRFKEK